MDRDTARKLSTIPRSKIGDINPGYDYHYRILSDFGKGKKIQIKKSSGWEDCVYPDFLSTEEYRLYDKDMIREPFFPKIDEEYYYLDPTLEVRNRTFNGSDYYHSSLVKCGNIFKTYEEACKAAEIIKEILLSGSKKDIKSDIEHQLLNYLYSCYTVRKSEESERGVEVVFKDSNDSKEFSSCLDKYRKE